MKKQFIRVAGARRTFALGAASLTALAMAGLTPIWAADVPSGAVANRTDTNLQPTVATPAESADVAELKSNAFREVRAGNFDQADDLLSRAARVSNDASLIQMHDWTDTLDTQLHTFADQRHKAYEKAISDEQLLLSKGHEDYALDLANRAMLLTDDKTAFTDLPWVKTLVANAITHGEEYQKSQQWLRAMRVYADLAAIQPSSRDWKEDLKDVQRRVRMLVWYAPDALKQIEEKEAQERDEVTTLLNKSATTAPAVAAATTAPTTQPGATAKAANPTTEPTLELSDALRVDWKQSLHDIRMPMLQSAMHDAEVNYYRDVSYKDLMLGGLNGIRAMLTTHGLEKTFPALAEPAKRDAMLHAIDQWTAAANAAPGDGQGLLDQLLSNDKDSLLGVNDATVQLPEEVVVSEFAGGALGVLDPFSSMIWPSMLDDFNKTTQGEFSGVGISIQPNDDGYIGVISPLEDTPAYRAGIKAGDEIVGINGKSTKGITSDEAVRTITGPTGSTVRLTIRSVDGSQQEHTLRREIIKVASVKGFLHKPGGGWDYYVDPQDKIAYIRITNFTKSSADELDKAIADMGDSCNGIILDLRGDPGGLLSAAIDVADKFIDSGVIVSTRPDRQTPNDKTIAYAKADENQFKKPLVVLVNQFSASASEIVSGALKDDKRAILVGERTFGKGSVQMLFPLTGRTAFLKLTTSHYYLPSGRCIHREETSTTWGVDPDVTVALTPEQVNDMNRTRGEMDVLRDVTNPPAAGADEKLKAVAAASDAKKTAAASTQPTPKDLLAVDPQLSAALLVLRLEVAGAQL